VKITFQNQTVTDTENRTESIQTEKNTWGRDKIQRNKKSVNANTFGAVYESGQIPMPVGNEENNKGKSLIELQQDAGNTNVALQQDYMTLLSHTMSQEDYAKACEDGFDPRELDQDTAVTIVDRIKAELVRSGQNIAGYTDDIDLDTLAAAVGSDTLAQSIEEQFRATDIPLTPENVDELKTAWELASSLQQPQEGEVGYLVDNGLEPEIWNLYVAENSGAKVQQNTVPQELQDQMDKVITDAGLPVNDENRQKAQWLVGAGLPLTTDTLQQLAELDTIDYPVSEDAFAQAAASALAEGKSPVHANLARQENIYEKATEMVQDWFSDAKWDVTAENLAARKQLEEIRLRMTAEVNVKLLQSDFSIDTAPMEQLIEALRRAEAEVADKYFPNDADAVAKYETYTQTVQVTNELPGLPVSVLGPYSLKQKVSQETVAEFHSEGKALQTAYTEANERYETLMTAPRRDLGDSIRKAFSNVDDILTDMSLDKTPENQRAVRILAYNRMEITAENIERVKEADEQVTAVVEKLTPKNVLQMIRDGVNPLEKTFGELESYFAENPQSYEEEAEDYSRFLYQLEQKKDITENERKAYIGIYRMVHQIEREDGAAVGAVVNTGAELQFSTLLAASRSRRTSHMDWKVSDDTGLTQEVRLSENNISEQISVGMAKEILTDVSEDTESRDAYYQECLQQMREAVETEPGAAQMLERGGVNTSTSNLLAAQALLEDPAELFSDLQRYRKKYNKEKEIPVAATGEEPAGTEASGLWEQLDQQNFADDYRTMLQDALQETETISLEQAESHLDVKQLQLVHKQLRLAGNLQNRQEYFLPMYLGDQLAGVHLTLQQGTGETSTVDIRVDAGDEQLEAHLQVNGEHIEGYLVGNTPEEVTKLEKTSDIFLEWIQTDTSADWKAEKLSVVSSRDMTRMAAGETQNAETIESRADAAQLYRLAKGFLQAVADSSGK
jgi:PKD repeat protein